MIISKVGVLHTVSRDDVMGSDTWAGKASQIIGGNPGDVLDVIALGCQAAHRAGYRGVNFQKAGEGLGQVSGGLSVVNAFSDTLSTVDKVRACVEKPSLESAVDVSEGLAKAVADIGGSVSFFHGVGVISTLPNYVSPVTDGCRALASLIGAGKNINTLVSSNSVQGRALGGLYEIRFWQNTMEATANILTVALYGIALVGIVLGNVTTIVFAAAYLVATFAGHVFAKEAEQLIFKMYIPV